MGLLEMAAQALGMEPETFKKQISDELRPIINQVVGQSLAKQLADTIDSKVKEYTGAVVQETVKKAINEMSEPIVRGLPTLIKREVEESLGNILNNMMQGKGGQAAQGQAGQVAQGGLAGLGRVISSNPDLQEQIIKKLIDKLFGTSDSKFDEIEKFIEKRIKDRELEMRLAMALGYSQPPEEMLLRYYMDGMKKGASLGHILLKGEPLKKVSEGVSSGLPQESSKPKGFLNTSKPRAQDLL